MCAGGWRFCGITVHLFQLKNLHINGRELSMLSHAEFEERMPHGEVLWAHLQLLNTAQKQQNSVESCNSRDGQGTYGRKSSHTLTFVALHDLFRIYLAPIL